MQPTLRQLLFTCPDSLVALQVYLKKLKPGSGGNGYISLSTVTMTCALIAAANAV
jgi:hypothetical protein